MTILWDTSFCSDSDPSADSISYLLNSTIRLHFSSGRSVGRCDRGTTSRLASSRRLTLYHRLFEGHAECLVEALVALHVIEGTDERVVALHPFHQSPLLEDAGQLLLLYHGGQVKVLLLSHLLVL